jgi:predicted transport protein
MVKLVQCIEMIRARLENLRKHSLKETPTRTIIIDPLLESLGWDIRDPDEVQLEYPTVDGKFVDYAMKINRRVLLLLEAKALDDPLDDVKAITQVVGYAANDGIVWCILTNGVKWKVYRSVEKCPAPEKLMFEVSLDPRDSEGTSVQQLAQQMWRFSREEIAKGTLDTLGEQTFTDGKVRKALNVIMQDPPRQFLNIVRSAMGDESISPQKVKESIARVWADTGIPGPVSATHGIAPTAQQTDRSAAAKKAWVTRRGLESEVSYDESHHTSGKPQEVLELYHALDRLCLSLRPGEIEKRYVAKCINYRFAKKTFCSVHIQQGGLRVWLQLKHARLENPPAFARDVSNIGHWGGGDLELGLNSLSQFDEAAPLIRMSLEART